VYPRKLSSAVVTREESAPDIIRRRSILPHMTNKRRLVFFFAVLFGILLLTVGWFMAKDASFCSTVTYEGDGTASSPYRVENVRQLQCIEDRGLDANYVQISDIDASETSEWNGGEGFEPIGEVPTSRSTGADYTSFRGTFEGQGYNITDLTIEHRWWVGMFASNDGEITKVSLLDIKATGRDRVGSLVGVNRPNGTISESYATGSVEGGSSAGGLVGFNWGTVSDSYATASVKGSLVVGGLVGENHGTVGQSYTTGTVSGSDGVGGLVGNNAGRTISNSYATGSIEGDENVGGLVGSNSGSTVKKSYATGSVEGNENVGGLIGFQQESGTASNSYWDVEATGQSTSAGGTGLKTSQMTGSAARGNMTGFDFNNTWASKPNEYPMLAWEQKRR